MKILTSQHKAKYVFDGRVENKLGQLIKQTAHAETWAVTLNEAKRNIHHQLTSQLRLGRGYPIVFNEEDIRIVDDQSLSEIYREQDDIVDIDETGYTYTYNNCIIYYNTVTNYYDILDTHYHLIAKDFIDEEECEEYIDNLK